MTKYIAVGWPNIQKYQEMDNFPDVGYDPEKNLWFVPEDMINNKQFNNLNTIATIFSIISIISVVAIVSITIISLRNHGKDNISNNFQGI